MANNEMNLRERLEQIQSQDEQPKKYPVQNNTKSDEEAEALAIIDNDNTPDYKDLIKQDIDGMTEDEFEQSRNFAFESVKNNFTKQDSDTNNDTEEKIVEGYKSKAELYEEQNPIIKTVEKKEVEEEKGIDAGSVLMDSLTDIDKDTENKSKALFEMQKQYNENNENSQINESNTAESDNSVESIDDVISSIEQNNIKKDIDVKTEDEENLSVLIEKLESQKMYSKYKETENYTGPSAYTIENSPEYENAVEDVLNTNGFNIVKKSNSEKNAILDKFVNSGTQVTVPLVNSGIYVTMTGGSTTEIISMNQLTGSTSARNELEKLNIINNHIVGSSIGKMRLSQLIKVVSYYDIETLYYAFYAATYPNMSEVTRYCGRCGQEYFIKLNTRDMLINPEDYADDAKDIRNNVTTFAILKEKSQLNKVIKKVCDKGNLIIYFKHPSIESHITTSDNITDETNRLYSQLVDMAYAIDKLYLRDSGNQYIEFNDPNSIISVIAKIKDVDTRYELLDILEEIRPNAIPSYGFKDTICPHCGNKDNSEAFSVENLLFTQAQQKEEMATLRWAAKLQERRNQKKK